MTTRGTSPIRRKRLGARLRELRQASGENGQQVSATLGWSQPTVSRYEAGSRTVKRGHILALADYYQLEGVEREELLTLWRLAAEPSWWYPYRDILGEHYAGLIDLENDAAMIRTYQEAIHGLLQVESYARALIMNGPRELSRDEIDRRVEIRLHRQQVLDKDSPARLWVILDEAALHRKVGGNATMRAQLEYLLELNKRGRLTIQVIPFDVGAHPAPTGGFTVFDLSDGSKIAFMETVAGDLYLEKEQEIDSCQTAFDHLNGSALNRSDSESLIIQRLQEYR